MSDSDKARIKELINIIHDMIVAQQSAWIEWRHGGGAKAGMQWIENGLSGPGNIPDESMSKYYKDAQYFFDEQKSEPFPVCVCGKPSRIMWMGNGYCCDSHYEIHKACIKHKSNNIAAAAIQKMKS